MADEQNGAKPFYEEVTVARTQQTRLIEDGGPSEQSHVRRRASDDQAADTVPEAERAGLVNSVRGM